MLGKAHLRDGEEGRLKALRLGVRAIRISEKSLTELVNINTVDPDEYFGFIEN